MTLTKTELRDQQHKLRQLQKYLPTLQLKKMLLQAEVHAAQQEIDELNVEFQAQKEQVASFSPLFSAPNAFDLFSAVKIARIDQSVENIAGIDLPVLDRVVFQESNHMLFDAPVWLDSATTLLRRLVTLRESLNIARERKKALEKELHEVSIRVNLFEKILIPRAQEIIRRIKIFLGDQQLAAICQAKVAKLKIEAAS